MRLMPAQLRATPNPSFTCGTDMRANHKAALRQTWQSLLVHQSSPTRRLWPPLTMSLRCLHPLCDKLFLGLFSLPFSMVNMAMRTQLPCRWSPRAMQGWRGYKGRGRGDGHWSVPTGRNRHGRGSQWLENRPTRQRSCRVTSEAETC
jgi:hypothetical protein